MMMDDDGGGGVVAGGQPGEERDHLQGPDVLHHENWDQYSAHSAVCFLVNNRAQASSNLWGIGSRQSPTDGGKWL